MRYTDIVISNWERNCTLEQQEMCMWNKTCIASKNTSGKLWDCVDTALSEENYHL